MTRLCGLWYVLYLIQTRDQDVHDDVYLTIYLFVFLCYEDY